MEPTNNGMPVFALVPAYNDGDTVGETVVALLADSRVDVVIVVDDGSSDDSALRAQAAGAQVVRHGSNRGKAAAVLSGLELVPAEAILLLADADTGATASDIARLLDPVLASEADLVIGVLPSAQGRGGLGTVVRFARGVLQRATGKRFDAPLSGQRAIRASLLKGLPLAPRFGLEVAMTAEAHKAGARIVELPIAVEHRHTGRGVSGFAHRARQGVDVARAAWLVRTSASGRNAIRILLALAALVAMVMSSLAVRPGGAVVTPDSDRVIFFSLPTVSLEELTSLKLPNLRRIYPQSAVAADSVRTASTRPSISETFATVSAGSRVPVPRDSDFVYGADEEVQGGTAAQLAERNNSGHGGGEIVVPYIASMIRAADAKHLPSTPGALADALHRNNRRTAAIGNADYTTAAGTPVAFRPVALAAMDSSGSVDAGSVGRELLTADTNFAFGWRADPAAMMEAFDKVSDVGFVAIDSGDLIRVSLAASSAASGSAGRQRTRALFATDEILGRVVDRMGPRDLLIVASTVPTGADSRLLPILLYGAGVQAGTVHSPSTRRGSLIALTDVTVTSLHAIGLNPDREMVGSLLRIEPGSQSLERIKEIDALTAVRNKSVGGLARSYAWFQTILYLFAAVALGRFASLGRTERTVQFLLLIATGYPIATFLMSYLPVGWIDSSTNYVGVILLATVGLAWLSRALSRSALGALQLLCGLTFSFLLFDIATGGRAQWAGLLTAPPTNAGRFFGFGNPAYAIIATTAIIWAALHVRASLRKGEALVTVAGAFVLVTLADGAPTLGADVGGLITLFPILLLTLWLLAGKKLRTGYLLLAGLGTVALGALATLVDLLRPIEHQSHLGRFVNDIRADGGGVFLTTVTRKLSANLLSYGSPWVWALPAILAYVLYMLIWHQQFNRLLPVRSAERAGAIGALAVGVIGYAANDSGAVITALAAVYVGPFFTFLASERTVEAKLDWGPAP